MGQVHDERLTNHEDGGTISLKQRRGILMEKYLISTNAEGHLFGNYTTEKLLSKQEAIEVLRVVKEVDPNATLVRVVEERRNEFGDY